MDLNKLVRSKIFKWVLIALGEFILLLLVFWLGATVGLHKADFAIRWGENYERNFGPSGPGPGIMRDFMAPPGGFMNPHGTSGTVLKIDGATLIIKGENNTEKTVLTSDDTTIRKQMQNIKVSDIKINDNVVIIGSPNNQGQIEAKFVRVF